MKTLFIGNSHTYYNDMPALFKCICEENGIEMDIYMLAHSGKGLDFHLEEPEVRFNILYGSYDYIVLQHLAHPFNTEEQMISSAVGLKKLIGLTKSKIVVFMTWETKENENLQPVMTAAYYRMGRQIDALVAPVGDAWWKLMHSCPDFELYDEDGQHASLIGSKLAAYTIFSTMFNEKAVVSDTLCQKLSEQAYQSHLESDEYIRHIMDKHVLQ